MKRPRKPAAPVATGHAGQAESAEKTAQPRIGMLTARRPSLAGTLVVLVIAAPWLILLPLTGPLAILAQAVTLVAACHGAGLVVARLARQPAAPPLLVIQWGIATLIGLSGLATAFRIGGLACHAALGFTAAAVHSATLAVRFADTTARVRAALAGPRGWLVPALALAALGTLGVLGAAGDTLPRPFDDEGHLLAQLTRVLDTGTLGDPIGYPRSAQLGGQVALAAIASGIADGAAGFLEPLAMLLALGLAVAQIAASREPGAALWASLLVAGGYGLGLAPVDPLPCWVAVGLIVTLYATLDLSGDRTPPPALPIAITAGALIALRYELAPIAAVALVIAWLRRRHAHHRTAILIGGVFAVGFPFLVTRMVAWRSVPMLAHASLAGPPQAALVLRLLLAAAIAVPAALVLRLVVPDSRTLRVAATATAIALAALAAHVTGSGPYALRMAWPIAIGFALTLVIELARSPATTGERAGRTAAIRSPFSLGPFSPAAAITALVLCLVIYEGREAPGRLRWSRRLATAATAVDYVRRPPPAVAPPYARVLAAAPPGTTVAVWVSSPEQLDYARHRIIDVRTPIGARLRAMRRDPRGGKLESLLSALSASYLLLEADTARAERAQDRWLYRLLCRGGVADRPWCADNLEAIALRHPLVAHAGSLQLVDLRH